MEISVVKLHIQPCCMPGGEGMRLLLYVMLVSGKKLGVSAKEPLPTTFLLHRCPWLTKAISPAIPVYNGLVFLFVLANFSMATFMDPGVFPRGNRMGLLGGNLKTQAKVGFFCLFFFFSQLFAG